MTKDYDFQITKEKINLFFSMGELEHAEELVKTALKKHKNESSYYSLLGLVYHKQSRFPLAIEAFTRGVKENSEDPGPRLGLAITLCDIGEYEKANQLLEDGKWNHLNNEGVNQEGILKLTASHLETSRLYEQVNLLDQAQEEVKKALGLDPNSFQSNLRLAKILYKQEKLEQARGILESIVEEANKPEGYLWLGLVLYKSNNKHRAKEAWEKAYFMDPNNPTIQAYRDQVKGHS